MAGSAVYPESRYTAGEDREDLQHTLACGESFERGVGIEFKERCEKFFRQYRSFTRLRSAWIPADPPDRDVMLYDAKRDWGANLHIPLSFRTIETVVPAAISQRPRMLYFPRRQKWAENVVNIRTLIDAQQDQIDIDLPYQAVMRSGRIYGLGVGKVLWRKEYAYRRRVKPKLFDGTLDRLGFEPKYTVSDMKAECVFDDPDFEDVDVFDFMWDPYGSDVRSCGWLIHRTWPSLKDCLHKLRSGEWNTQSAKNLLKDGREEDALRSMGGRQRYDEVWQARMEASGFSQHHFSDRGEHVHELWEWHDGTRVWKVLDRTLLVASGENPVAGMKPFFTYRPTPLQKQMVGIGDLEPLEHLQRELDTARSQMRDAVTVALATGFAYDASAVDEDDLVWQPNLAIEVRNARPSDAIYPLPKPELPSSSFRDVEMIRTDMNDIGGVTEALDPSQPQSSGTATEAFLVQAALSRRVQLASRRFEIEVVRGSARAFLYLNQRMILTNREMVLPPEGMTLEQAAEMGQWRRFDIGPMGLMGDFVVRPEGGSMAARNVPQDRADADRMLALSQNPYIDPRRAMTRALELMGIDDPSGWLKRPEQPLPPSILQTLEKMGVDPRLIQVAVQVEQQANPQLPPQEQGPNVEQMNMAMGVPQQPQEAPA